MHRRAIPGGGGRAVAILPSEPQTHAEDSSCLFVVWAVMPPTSWIPLPMFFADELPLRGPLVLLLQHVGCCSLATGAEVEVVPSVTSS